MQRLWAVVLKDDENKPCVSIFPQGKYATPCVLLNAVDAEHVMYVIAEALGKTVIDNKKE